MISIVDKSKREMPFSILDISDVFKFDGRIFMKVTDYDTGEFNAFDFTKKGLTDISSDVLVEYMPSELILHERD